MFFRERLPWSTRIVGLGLWNSVPGTLMVGGSLFISGGWLYADGDTEPIIGVGGKKMEGPYVRLGRSRQLDVIATSLD